MAEARRYPRRTLPKPSYADATPPPAAYRPLSQSTLPNPPALTFSTPQRLRSATASVVASQNFQGTPTSHGAGSMAGFQEGVIPEDAKHYLENYKTYIREDLATNRVLVDKDDFLEVVYNISRQERQSDAHTKLLEDITAKKAFQTAWNDYMKACNKVGRGKRPEKKLYPPRVALYNAVLDILTELDSNKLEEKERIRFYVNDPARLTHGVYANGLSVDLGQVSESLFGKEEKPSLKGSPHPLGAAMLLGAEEMKAKPGCLITGKELIYRAMNLTDGRAPEVNKDPSITDSKAVTHDGLSPKLNDDPFLSAHEGATEELVLAPPVLVSRPSGSKKRKSSQNSISSISKVSRVAMHTSLPECKEIASKDQETDDESDDDSDDPLKSGKMPDAQSQCASYAMEALSLTPLRSHFIMSLVDRADLQLMYFDSSVMLVTPPIDMKSDEGQELYLSMIVGLRRMSLLDRGVRNLIRDNHKFFTCVDFFGRQLTRLDSVPHHWRNMLTGMTLDTPTGGSYKIERILFRQAGIVGRLTYVVRAKKVDPNTSKEVGPFVVIKISLPSVSHPATEDVGIVNGSTQERVAKFIHDAGRFEGAKYPYEYRVLRIVVLEELYPISTLGEPSQYAQVFFDILNCHKWLHDIPRILHRDISMSNVMYRFDDDGNVCGVLNDMDLSSDLNDLEDLKATSMRRTGTPPFMAVDLLRKNSHQPRHIYRHDLESLFYVMLILFSRYKLLAGLPADGRAERLAQRGKPPLSEWFNANLSWEMLGKDKHIFIMDATELTSPLHTNNLLSSSFQGFKPWMLLLKNVLEDGFDARRLAIRKAGEALASGGEPPSFVYETLGGKVQYSTFFNAMKNFGAKALRAPPYSLDTNPTA